MQRKGGLDAHFRRWSLKRLGRNAVNRDANATSAVTTAEVMQVKRRCSEQKCTARCSVFDAESSVGPLPVGIQVSERRQCARMPS